MPAVWLCQWIHVKSNCLKPLFKSRASLSHLKKKNRFGSPQSPSCRASRISRQYCIFKTHMCSCILGTFHTRGKKSEPKTSGKDQDEGRVVIYIFLNKLHSFNKRLEVLVCCFSSWTVSTTSTCNNNSLSWPWIIKAWFVQKHLHFPYMLQHIVLNNKTIMSHILEGFCYTSMAAQSIWIFKIKLLGALVSLSAGTI